MLFRSFPWSAQSKHDEAEVERIKTRLQELEASRQAKQKDAKALKLAEMNRKNRFENFKNASELKPVNIGLKAGEAGYDPFSRRWTRSRNYYAAKPGEKAAAGNNIVNGNVAGAGSNATGAPVTAEAGMVATAAALEAAAGAGKLVDQMMKSEKYGERRGAAFGLAGLVKGFGISCLKKYRIVITLQESLAERLESLL